MLLLKGFVQRHKLILAIMLLAAATPSAMMAIPSVFSEVAALPPQAKFAVLGITLAFSGAALFASGRWLRSFMTRAFQTLEDFAKRRQSAKEALERVRQWKVNFVIGDSPGADKVAIIEEAAGNISNISREPGSLDPELQEELAVGRRKVTVVADTSPGIEIDTPPELQETESGEKVAAFVKEPVRDEIGVAIRHGQQWLVKQLPFLNAFLKGCEVQVGTHIVSHGSTSLVDALHGFAPRARGTEANAHFLVEEAPKQDIPKPFSQNGHNVASELHAVPVLAGGLCDDPDLSPILNHVATRPAGRREQQVDHRDLREHLLDLEAEFTDMAAVQRDLIFLISNKEDVKENRQIRDIVDIFSSACLRNFSPLGAPSKPVSMDYADISHVPAGPWIPSVPLSFSDTHAAFGTAREIGKGQWSTPFYGFAPDRIPLSRRGMAATFVTGNPRVGQEFINSLERALPIHNVVIAHWNQSASTAWALFCVPATPFEIKAGGLKLDAEAFA